MTPEQKVELEQITQFLDKWESDPRWLYLYRIGILRRLQKQNQRLLQIDLVAENAKFSQFPDSRWPMESLPEDVMHELLGQVEEKPWPELQADFPDLIAELEEMKEARKHGQELTTDAKQLDPFIPMSEWKVEKPKEIVKDLLIEDGVHVFAGLFESMKTMASYELAAAITEGRPAFGFFPTYSTWPVLHLCLDMSPGLQLKDASYFGLHKNPKFKGLNPKLDAFLAIDSDEMRRECCGKVLILDTMLDWFPIREAFQSKEWIDNFARLRQLIRRGCKAVVLITHPTKSGARNTTIDASEFLKDSVTFGGKLDMAFAFRRVEKTSKIFVERIKGRWYERPITFTLASHDDEGNSFIDRGQFPVVDRPGEAGTLAGQLSGHSDQGLRECLENGMSHRAIAKMLGISQPTVTRRAKALGFSKKEQLDLIEDISKEGAF